MHCHAHTISTFHHFPGETSFGNQVGTLLSSLTFPNLFMRCVAPSVHVFVGC